MSRRWRDYDDGFDEEDLYGDEYLGPASIRIGAPIKSRPKLRAVRRKPTGSEPREKEIRSQRLASNKAWGTPY